MIICLHGTDQFFLGKIRPGNRGKVKLRIGQLPEQEVGDPLLIAGADQKIRIRDPSRIQTAAEIRLGEVLRLQLPLLHFTHQFLGSPEDLVPSAVIDGDLEVQTVIVLSCFLQLGDPVPNILIQSGLLSQHPHTHAVLFRRLQTGLHIVSQQLHQRVHLVLGTIPVLRGESIHRQVLDPHPVGFLTDDLHCLGALHMAVVSGHSLCLCPSAVAVQDNGNVTGHLQLFTHLSPSLILHRRGSGSILHSPRLFFLKNFWSFAAVC